MPVADARPLRLLFFGTPDFAVPSLRATAESRHSLVGVISQPDRPRGRGRELAPTPVKQEAERHGLDLLQPEKVGSDESLAWMRAREPELGIVVAFGQFIPKRVRELPAQGLINAHASLLPRHRGAAPIAWAILCGDAKTGISVMRVEKEMDAGDVCRACETPIGPDETAGELESRLAELAAEALLAAVDEIAAGSARFEPQDHAAATTAPKLDREFARLDWTKPRDEVLRRIRAATPRPGCDLHLVRSGRRLRVLAAGAAEAPSAAWSASPGAVDASGDRLRIRALDGWVEVLRLMRPGRSPLGAAEYLRGARVPGGEEVESA